MNTQIIPQDLRDVQPIHLPDGTVLDDRQTRAVTLLTTTNMTRAEIAQHAGYSSESAVNRFLSSNTGMLGVREALKQHATMDGLVGLQTLRTLARHAKSEKVRYDAAAKLVDMAGLRQESISLSNKGSRDVSISINLGKSDDVTTLDVTPVEGPAELSRQSERDRGVGEKERGAGGGDPTLPDKIQSAEVEGDDT